MNEKFIEENYDTQNTKNEQQKDLCITRKQLTEQWKKGELPAGWYYIKIADIVFIDFFEGKVWKNKKDKYIDEVLAPVPSYEKWQASYNCMLEKENKELKKQVNHLSKTQARQFVDNQKLQVKAEKAKDVIDIEATRKIKQLEQIIESQKQTNLALIKRLEEKVTNVKEALDFLQAESSELSI